MCFYNGFIWNSTKVQRSLFEWSVSFKHLIKIDSEHSLREIVATTSNNYPRWYSNAGDSHNASNMAWLPQWRCNCTVCCCQAAAYTYNSRRWWNERTTNVPPVPTPGHMIRESETQDGVVASMTGLCQDIKWTCVIDSEKLMDWKTD